MFSRSSIGLALCLGVLFVATGTAAATPNLMNYQGQLDSSGSPISGTYQMVFTIYDAPTGGAVLWTETQSGVSVQNGLCNVLLGTVNPIVDSVFASTACYLGIQVGSDPEMTPRSHIVTVGYAHRVSTVDGATGGTISGDVSIQSDLTVSGKAKIGSLNGNPGAAAFVAGESNLASGDYSTVGGGEDCGAEGNYATVGGGYNSMAKASNSTVSGGRNNITWSQGSTVSGGEENRINGAATFGSVIAGGVDNLISGTGVNQASVIGGGSANTVSGRYSSILGSEGNTIFAHYSYLFGIGGTLTHDSTFMVDMPHIRFGDSLTGYDFPTADGSADQVMTTNGSGQLSWADQSGGGPTSGWEDDGGVVRLEDSSDLVGIGTVAPGDLLEVAHANARGITIAGDADSTSPFLTLVNPDNDSVSILTARDGRAFDFEYGDGNRLMVIENAGDVGIGTADPFARLDVWKIDSPGPVYAVMGTASSLGNASNIKYGVFGNAAADEGRKHGVFGTAYGTGGDKYGVYGDASGGGGIAYGVYGRATGSGTNYAGYFEGNVAVTGTLSKGGGSFKIDHPLDPENKYLYHSFVESPDMMNVYNGNVRLDARGEATVELPDYFQSLNRDFRYQLTCIGGFAPVYVAAEISGNRFSIGGGEAGMKVSWQVTGVRQDLFANTHRIPVEEDKPSAERGKYLHPKAYGLGIERGIDADHQALEVEDDVR